MGFLTAFGQQWMIYDASVLPSQTGGAAFDLTSLSQDSPGPNFVEMLESDPDIAGNSVLRYVQPDTNATKMYRTLFTGWTGTNLTLVTRLKGLPDWQMLGLDRVFDLQIRNGNAGKRDQLRLNYADNSVELDRSPNASAQPGIDMTEWHVYRICMFGDSSVVYVDENPIPALTGVSTSSTGDSYLKVGDGSGEKIGGLVDWMALDTTGAYSPALSPLLDPKFTGVGHDPVAADWLFYPADVLPSQTGSDPFDLTSLSQDAPGPNFEEVIVGDPAIPGNRLLRYVQPDTNSTKMYRHIFDGAWTGQNLTLIARMRGLDDWQALGLDRVFDLQYRHGNSGKRDELRLDYSDNSVELDRSPSATVQPGIDLTEWHIYRIAVHGDSSVVYVDENPIPVLTGVSTASTSDTYIKIGDGSGDKVGGWVDWVALDTTGAYSPLQTALDSSMFTGVGTPTTLADIVFITQTDLKDASNSYGDSLYVAALHNAGYHVNVPAYSDYSNVDSAEAEVLKAADLVIIGRGVSSGDFDDADDVIWEELETPIIMMSNYVARSNRLRWFNSSSALYAARFGTQQATVNQPMDTAFTGLTISGNVIDYAENNLGFIRVTDAASINGELLLTMINGQEGYDIDTDNGSVKDTIQLSAYDGNVLMARFAPGDSMYFGGGAMPAGWRTFMTAGDDHDYDTTQGRRLYNFHVFTEDMHQVFLNEVDYLIRGPKRDSTVGIENLIDHELLVNVYPNPFDNQWNIKLELEHIQKIQLSLYSLDGRLLRMYQPQMVSAGERVITIDGQQLTSGVYIYQLRVGERYMVGKIQKR